jgi:hypothetical protein
MTNFCMWCVFFLVFVPFLAMFYPVIILAHLMCRIMGSNRGFWEMTRAWFTLEIMFYDGK